MRLLIDAHVFDGAFQGTRTYLEGLYTHLSSYKDIDFFFAAQDTDNLKKVLGEAKNIHYVRLQTGNKWKRLAFEFPRIIKENAIDYAHYQYIAPLRKCCKEIVTVHDLLFMDLPQFFTLTYSLPKRILFRRSAKRADMLLTVSDYSRESIAKNFNIDRQNIHITYNSILPAKDMGMQVDIKTRFGFDKYILTVSRIEPRKNHLALLRAYVELNLAGKGYHLVMVGTKDLAYQEFFSYLEGQNDAIKQCIHFMKVGFNDLVALYRNAALFVFPSYAEGFGIPPLEALAYGCPLLCSNATAMAEFGLPDEISFNPYDVEELKQKMRLLLEHPINMDEIRLHVISKYNWQKIADDFYKLLTNKGNKAKISYRKEIK